MGCVHDVSLMWFLSSLMLALVVGVILLLSGHLLALMPLD